MHKQNSLDLQQWLTETRARVIRVQSQREWKAVTLLQGDQKIILINSRHPIDMQVMSLLHEVSHLRLDHGALARPGLAVSDILEAEGHAETVRLLGGIQEYYQEEWSMWGSTRDLALKLMAIIGYRQEQGYREK